MPLRALRPCTWTGCSTLVRSGRCEAHPYPDTSAHNPKYGTAYWKRTRAAQLRSAPLCERHLGAGQTVLALEVHHRDGDSSNDHPDNLESLCRPCHSAHTAREHGGFGNRRRA